ncbi:MAG: acyl-CoA synthetase [Deltaproteobacteria bacterium]|nr:acyl-CoA synthetase [Deltaproteobacteria bacterium]
MTKAESYNIGIDCVDKHADTLQNKHKIALIYLKEDPETGILREPPLRLSYSSLQRLTNAMANAMAGLGLPAGSRILLRLNNSAEFPISFLGAVKAGHIPIPTSPLLTWTELEFLLQDSEAAAIVTAEDLLCPELKSHAPKALLHLILIGDKELAKAAPEIGLGIHRWQDLLKNSPAQFETQATPAEAPAFWLYTSGTEGRPKAVIHAHRSIRAHDARAKVWQDLRAGDVVFNTSSLNWSYALTCGLLDVWRHGLTSVVYQGRLNPEQLSHIVRRHGVTTFMTVPGIYRRLVPYLGEHPEALAGLRVCLSAGEKLNSETRRSFREFTGLEIHEGLGMTEHSVYLVQPFGETPVEESCGRPLLGQNIAVLREDLTECAPDEIGALASARSCEGLMLGYHRRPEEEAQAFRGDWFLSGDLASRDAGGNFHFLGRRDDVLTSGGYRISPMEIENALNLHPSVSESAAVNLEVEAGKNIVEAFVVLKTGVLATQATATEILDFAASRLAKYKLPRQIVFLRELPKTSNGKLKRNNLKK